MNGENRNIEELFQNYQVPEESLWSEDEILSFIPQNEKSDAKIIRLDKLWSKIAAAAAIVLILSIGNMSWQNGGLNSETFVGVDELTAEEAQYYLTLNE